MALLAHLYSHIRGSQEDIATLSLQYILSQSLELNFAFTKFVSRALSVDLPDHLNYITQKTGKDKERPDISGINELGQEYILCEAKFYAGLTSNQPLGYLDRLQQNNGKGLLFICPANRRSNLWAKLNELCAGRTLVSISDYCVLVDNVRLALTTWAEVLDLLHQTAAAVEVQSLADIEQLMGFCRQMDDDAFIPFTQEELGAETARLEERYYRIIDAMIDAFKSDSNLKVSGKGLRNNGNRDGYVTHFCVNNNCVTIRYDRRMWLDSHTVETPFWTTLYDDNWNQPMSYLRIFNKYPERNKFVSNRVSLALFPPVNETLDEVANDLKAQVMAYLGSLNE